MIEVNEQLLLWQESKEEKLEREVKNLREQCEKVRKSQYAKIGELKKLYMDQKYEIDTLKAAMCRSTELNLQVGSRELLICDKA